MLQRGRYDLPDKSQPVTADVPDVLPPLPADAPRNRLGLARWLTSPGESAHGPRHGQSALAAVFRPGAGEDAGQFRRPVRAAVASGAARLAGDGADPIGLGPAAHPAADRRQQHLSAAVGSLAGAYQRDPENRLLARGPRQRLPAEAVRDNALAVSGLLVDENRRPVGDAVPTGRIVGRAGGRRVRSLHARHGDDLYRRSLYVYRKRTVPHPSMATFDAPSWEICQVKRARTNTPLQALALLNDVTYVEAARKFAERMLTEGGTSAECG